MLELVHHIINGEYCLHETVTLGIISLRKLQSTKAKVDSSFQGMTISDVTLLCWQYFYIRATYRTY